MFGETTDELWREHSECDAKTASFGELGADDGKPYYFGDNGEIVSEKPEKFAWKELTSDSHDGAKYYYNEITGISANNYSAVMKGRRSRNSKEA